MIVEVGEGGGEWDSGGAVGLVGGGQFSRSVVGGVL